MDIIHLQDLMGCSSDRTPITWKPAKLDIAKNRRLYVTDGCFLLQYEYEKERRRWNHISSIYNATLMVDITNDGYTPRGFLSSLDVSKNYNMLSENQKNFREYVDITVLSDEDKNMLLNDMSIEGFKYIMEKYDIDF